MTPITVRTLLRASLAAMRIRVYTSNARGYWTPAEVGVAEDHIGRGLRKMFEGEDLQLLLKALATVCNQERHRIRSLQDEIYKEREKLKDESLSPHQRGRIHVDIAYLEQRLQYDE